jgi:hypothetical protein
MFRIKAIRNLKCKGKTKAMRNLLKGSPNHAAKAVSPSTHPVRRVLHALRVFFFPSNKASILVRLLAGFAGIAIVGGSAYGVTNWVVGLAASSSGEAQSASVTNISITAVATPVASNQLYPGGNGDVVAVITNPNPFPVTVTGVSLPANTTYAAGFSNSALSTAQTGCSSSTSLVSWNYATGTSGTAHTLTTALTVAASGTLTVTLTNDASMALTTPAACEATYFSMPSLTAVAATGGAASATTSPATDAWTS